MYLTLALLFCVLHMLRFLQPGCTVAGTNNVWMTGVLMMQFIISLKHSTHGATNNHFDSCVSLCLSACLVVSPTRAQQYLSFINNRFWHFPSISSLGLSEVQQIAVSRFRWFKGAVKGSLLLIGNKIVLHIGIDCEWICHVDVLNMWLPGCLLDRWLQEIVMDFDHRSTSIQGCWECLPMLESFVLVQRHVCPQSPNGGHSTPPVAG